MDPKQLLSDRLCDNGDFADTKVIDFIYQSLRHEVINDFTKANTDQQLNLLNMTIVILNEKYDRAKFQNLALDKLQESRKLLLEEVHLEVDRLVSSFWRIN